MRSCRSCPTTTSRCRQASKRIFAPSPTPLPFPSFCTIPPSRTVRELADDTLVRLAEKKRIVGLRDGTGDTSRIARLTPRLAGFRLLSGDDATALAFLACGGDGCISQVANVTPNLCRDIISSCRQGRLQRARYLQNRIARLTLELSSESPAALKYALSLLGLMLAHTRLPITELGFAERGQMARVLAALADEDLVAAGA